MLSRNLSQYLGRPHLLPKETIGYTCRLCREMQATPEVSFLWLRRQVRNAIVMRSGTGESRRAVTMMGRGQVVRRGSLDPVFEGSNPSAPANSPSPGGGGPLEDRADG
jgi:hypothetical protein